MSDVNQEDSFGFLFQRKVIRLLLDDFDFLSRYGDIIKPEYFSDSYHKELYNIILSYFVKYNKSPTPEVLVEEVDSLQNNDEKKVLIDEIEEIFNQDISDSEYYEKHILEFCKKRAVLVAIKEEVDKIREGELDSLLPSIEKALSVGQSFEEDSIGINYWKEFENEELYRPVPKIPTLLGEPGSGGVDDILGGGLEQGSVGLVMIPVGRGKSVFLINIAGNAVFQSKNALFISLELSERKLNQRFNSFFAGMSTKRLEDLSGREIKEKIHSRFSGMVLGDLIIKAFPMQSVTVRQIDAYIKLLESRFNWTPDIVCVDYLDIIRAPYPSKDNHQQLTDISVELKALAQKRQIPIWTAGQVNRGGAAKKRIGNEDASGSYQKIFALDVVFTGSPKVNEETGDVSTSLFCSKNRQGRDQVSIDFDLDFDRMRFNYRKRIQKVSTSEVIYKNFAKKRGR